MTPDAGPDVPFAAVATSGMSAYDGAATVIVGASDASRARIVQLIPAASTSADRVPVAAFQGAQRTGGYAIRIDRIERVSDRLLVHATFVEPPPDAIVIQVLTSPAHVVSVAGTAIGSVRVAVLFDQRGVERARADVASRATPPHT